MQVVEALAQVLPGFDEPVAGLVAAEVSRHARLRLGSRLDAVQDGDGSGGVTAVVAGTPEQADLVILATGIPQATVVSASINWFLYNKSLYI